MKKGFSINQAVRPRESLSQAISRQFFMNSWKLNFADVKLIAQWYCDKLGFTPSPVSDEICASLSHPHLGGLGIYTMNSVTPIQHGAGAFFRCDNIQKTITELRAKGVRVEKPVKYSSKQNSFSFFYDLYGNKLGIIE